MKQTLLIQAAQLAGKAAVDSINYAAKTSSLVSLMIKERVGDCPEAVYYIDGLRIDFDRAFKYWRAPTSAVISDIKNTVDATAYQAAADEYIMYVLRAHPHLKTQWKQAIAKAAISLQEFILQSNPPSRMFSILEQICPGAGKKPVSTRRFMVVKDTVDAWKRVYNFAMKNNPTGYMAIVRTLAIDLQEKTPTVDIGEFPTPNMIINNDPSNNNSSNNNNDNNVRNLWTALAVVGVGIGVGGLAWWMVKSSNNKY